jgi:hypothetical protein
MSIVLRRETCNIMSIQSSLLSTILTIALGTAILAQTGSPRVDTVEPESGKAGAVLAINGENLEKANVAELLFTDGKNDLKTEVVEQGAKSIKFKIPAAAKPGRYSIMLLTAGKDPKYLEQPVKVTVE